MPSRGISNILSRQRARQQSERVASDEEHGDVEEGIPPPVPEEEVFEDEVSTTSSEVTEVEAPRRSVTLEELEEEREVVRRRSSLCVLFVVFVLFKLWIEAIIDGDVGMLVVCFVGSSWTIRWIRFNQEREEELNRRIANYNSNNNNNSGVDRSDIRLLSFQAQLALAIIESQRTMMEGMTSHEEATPGVSDEAKTKWTNFKFSGEHKAAMTKTYNTKESNPDEGPHCSICLGEYQDNEKLSMLPCKHVYHEECIESWTENHQKCPLCNFDLESAAGDDATQTTADVSTVV